MICGSNGGLWVSVDLLEWLFRDPLAGLRAQGKRVSWEVVGGRLWLLVDGEPAYEWDFEELRSVGCLVLHEHLAYWQTVLR